MKSNKGQALVEFALVIPIFIMLLFGILDFGRVFHAYLTIDHAGREAAREASVGGEYDEILNTALHNGASINLTAGDVSIPPLPIDSGDPALIKITYPIEFITPVISNLTGPFTLETSTEMRVE